MNNDEKIANMWKTMLKNGYFDNRKKSLFNTKKSNEQDSNDDYFDKLDKKLYKYKSKVNYDKIKIISPIYGNIKSVNFMFYNNKKNIRSVNYAKFITVDKKKVKRNHPMVRKSYEIDKIIENSKLFNPLFKPLFDKKLFDNKLLIVKEEKTAEFNKNNIKKSTNINDNKIKNKNGKFFRKNWIK